MKVITAVAAAEKEAIQITWVKETLKRMMGGTLKVKFESRSEVTVSTAVSTVKCWIFFCITSIHFSNFLSLQGSDANEDGKLQKQEFFQIARDKDAVRALKAT